MSSPSSTASAPVPPPAAAPAPPAREGGRYVALDSLRGLAALCVVVDHFVLVRPDEAYAPGLSRALAGMAQHAAHSAVLLFFVLSGLVLSLPYWRGPVEPRGFLARRICRIAIPYWVALAVVFGLVALCPRTPIPQLSPWFGARWQALPTAGVMLQHALLIGVFAAGAYNPALWSLVIEMRVSLVYPLLIATFGRWRAGISVLVAAALTVAGFVVGERTGNAGLAAVCYTLRFLLAFVLGILLGRHRHQVVALGGRAGRAARAVLLLGGAVLALWPGALLPHAEPWRQLVNDVVGTVGAALLVVLALLPGRFAAHLNQQPWRYLGQISYSVYLYHGVLLLAWCHLLYPRVALGWVLLLTAVSTLVVAAAAYQWVELPSVTLGRYLSRRLASPASQTAARP